MVLARFVLNVVTVRRCEIICEIVMPSFRELQNGKQKKGGRENESEKNK